MIYVGTSGFQFQDWRKVFYPENIRNHEMFSYYARHFRALELNFTFYSTPGAKTIARLAEKAPEGFQFVIKANQEITHRLNLAQSDRFLGALMPCVHAGKFSAILAQFPYAFKNNERSRYYLAQVRDAFAGIPLVVEFRHRSWIMPSVFDYLRKLGLGFCCVDEPALPGLVPRVAEATSQIAYIRLHSRDGTKWFGTEGTERYNYIYSQQEMKDWVPAIKRWEADPGIEKLFVFFNNCHAGHAAVNATEFQELLRQMGLL